MNDTRCFVIAEAGVNHDGSLERALRLVDAAAEAGADAVKFQTFKADRLARPGAATAAYQRASTGLGSQHEMLRALEIPEGWYPRLLRRCADRGVEFMSTGFDAESVDLLVRLGVRRLKVPSGELNDIPFLAHVAHQGLPVLLSTGMATLEEVREAVAVLRVCQVPLRDPDAAPLTVLHCTSCYPAAAADANLRAMRTLHRELRVPVGYSDHTAGTLTAALAVALGATVIEKHLTLDRTLPGPDHFASLEPEAFAAMVRSMTEAEALLGSAEKRPVDAELAVRDLVRQCVTVRRPVPAGRALTRADLAVLRPGTGIEPKFLEQVIGTRAKADLAPWCTLTWEDLETSPPVSSV